MSDLEIAIMVAAEGAAVVRRRFGTNLQRLDKGAGDFATNADIEAENVMLAVLRRERPDDAVLGEESGRSGAISGSRMWLIDPLCGTLNYAARMRVVAVNVALRAGGRFIAAAPAFKAVTLAGDPGFTANFRPRVVSTSVALAWVATGQRAGYVTDGDVRDSVHFAAGLAICEGAGCIVSDLRGHAWGDGPTGLLVAADSETHAALLGLVRKYLPDSKRADSAV
jgi:myo-inositol-1(or 4)-monophosphatase